MRIKDFCNLDLIRLKQFRGRLSFHSFTPNSDCCSIKVRDVSLDSVISSFNQLELILSGDDEMLLVSKMKELVPEFLSINSEYEKLDHVKVIAIK